MKKSIVSRIERSQVTYHFKLFGIVHLSEEHKARSPSPTPGTRLKTQIPETMFHTVNLTQSAGA